MACCTQWHYLSRSGLILNYLDDCTIESVVRILTVPTSVLGVQIFMSDVVAAVEELADQAAGMR